MVCGRVMGGWCGRSVGVLGVGLVGKEGEWRKIKLKRKETHKMLQKDRKKEGEKKM